MVKFLLGLMFFFVATASGRNFENVTISSTPISGSVYMLQGAGGNVGVSAGEQGILIIDDQFAPLAEKIAAALQEINPASPKYIVNTHYHGDHTGGNAWFHKHKQVTVFAHDNVRKRLADKHGHHHNALPVVTYAQGVNFHFNGEEVRVEHLKPGHTDGDSLVWFKKANVVHMGDLFFEGRFPYIDLKSGGDVQGYVDNLKWALDKINDDTWIIPGHGKLSKKPALESFLNMIQATAAQVKKQKDAGQSLQQVLSKGLGEQWQDWHWSFITQEKWIKTLYEGQ